MTIQKFKNLGTTLEGNVIEKDGNVTYIRTPFRGEVYAVDQSDLIDELETTDNDNVICTSSVVDVEEWTKGISGTCLIQWEFHTEVNTEDGSINSYITIPKQKTLVEWKEEEDGNSFESWVIVGEQERTSSNFQTKNLKPSKLVLDLGSVVRVEF